jgi:hypothetical protein
MTRVVVNNEPHVVDATLKTWGDLLAWVDERSARQGRLVTAARLDGVDEPSFREPDHVARALSSVAVVEIDTDTPAALVLASLDEALDGLQSLRTFAVVAAGRFRGTDIASANQGLADLSQGLRTFVSLVAALSGALGVNFEALEWQGRQVSTLLEEIGLPLAVLSEAQGAEDWVTVADVLEFDLEPALEQSEPFFRALAEFAAKAGEPAS